MLTLSLARSRSLDGDGSTACSATDVLIRGIGLVGRRELAEFAMSIMGVPGCRRNGDSNFGSWPNFLFAGPRHKSRREGYPPHMKPILAVTMLAGCLQTTGVPQAPVELGSVRFMRSIDAGLAKAKSESKPAFVLFQEIPG